MWKLCVVEKRAVQISSVCHWMVFSLVPLEGIASPSVHCNLVNTKSADLEIIHAMFLQDETDLNPVTVDDAEIETLNAIQSLSEEDRWVYQLMKESVRMVDGHYELPLPWRHDYEKLPENKMMAVKRLTCLKNVCQMTQY